MDILSYVLGLQAGKTSGGGGSSGGGGLPAGCYREILRVKALNSYFQKWFRHNGELYLASLPYSGGGNDVIIYKYVDGAWIEYIPKTNYSNKGYLYGPSGWMMVEYNGNIHITTATDAAELAHYYFNGTEMIECAKLPGKGYGANTLIVHNNTLKWYCYGDGYLYSWDEATDTWAQEAQLSTTANTRAALFVIDGELYVQIAKILYKYTNGNLTSIGTAVEATYNAYGSIGDWIYHKKNAINAGYDLYGFNVKTLESKYVGFINTTGCNDWMEDGELRQVIQPSTDGNRIFAVTHIINPTE